MNQNSNNPEVSVIIPTYNRAHLIKRAIQSVLNQTYQDFEIIVVDDGSTDNTEEEVKGFNNQKIRYIRHNKNKGAAAAWNTGIKVAGAEFIAFQDSDDEWFPNKLKRQMEVFKNVSPKVGVVYTGSWLVRNNKRIYLPLFIGKHREGNIYKELFGGRIVIIPTPAVIVKKECFNQVGMFDERFPSLADWELWLRIAKYYEFKYIDEPLGTIYYTPNSVSTDLNAYIEARKLILEKHFEEFNKNKKLLARYLFNIGARLCLSGKTALGRRYFLKSFKTFPLNTKPLLAILISLLGSAFYNKITKLHLEIKKKIINDIYSERILNFLFLLGRFDLTTKKNMRTNNLPSIILLSMDSLRRDHLGCYGYKRNTSPNIDNIANAGAVFTQAVSNGTSTDSSIMISILTSYLFKNNILERAYYKMEMFKDPLVRFITLPELLQNKNYHTAFFGPSIIASFKIFIRSFNFFYACPTYLSKNMFFPIVRNFLNKHNIRFGIVNKIIFVILKKITTIILRYSKREKADFITNKAIKWIEKNKNGPFFLWLHYLDTHAPYYPLKPFSKIFLKDGVYHTGQKLPILHIDDVFRGGIPDSIAENNITDVDYYISQYDGAIRFIDEQIGKITKYLEREGLSKNTLIIITADYGEYLGENNFFTHNPFPLDEVMRIPLIIKYHKMFTHRIIDTQVESIDIAPTILDILHIDKSQSMQGESLLPLIQCAKTTHTPYIFLGGDEISVIRGDGYKLIRINQDRINELYKKPLIIPSLNIFGSDKIEYLLFGLKKDPGEGINLANTHKEILESLKEKLEKWLSGRTYEFGKVSRL